MIRFGKKGKLSPRFIGSFEILDTYRDMVYTLSLPLHISSVHLVFHIFMLKRYHPNDAHVIWWDYVVLDHDLSSEEKPIAILDMQTRKLRSKHICSVKVQ